ncbi:TIGR00730 family Rossman fold protein [Corynebacterium pyruviciproducens]|uniref:TIGR00730 family Rossman fold protein n=1 Tax=Corynebacterium pyruviciproducens TaxID=598660 RepID=A0AAF1BRL5_9CORY|nr:TIGR00730 family Rossman fold protein [Corynebacterium pyruviciproducens]WOT01908.1 TIGR00730 family Rossman fold protein [Corynebacterium pyruviciproducens]
MHIDFCEMTAADSALREKVAELDEDKSIASDFVSFIPARGDHGVVAKVDGEVAAVSWASFTRGATPVVRHAVVPQFRGHGIGLEILNKLVEYGKKVGWPAIAVELDEDNPARRSFARQGFESVDGGAMIKHLRPPLTSLAVYCGSAPGSRTFYKDVARELGEQLADRGITVVYGGGSAGLMGEMATGALRHGGRVHGVMARELADREQAYEGLTQLDIVDSVPERIAAMEELADGFLALPGGVGTLSELFDALTNQQIGTHNKPVILFNVEGYWNPLVTLLKNTQSEGFTAGKYIDALIVVDSVDKLVEELETWRSPGEKWQ